MTNNTMKQLFYIKETIQQNKNTELVYTLT